MPFRQIISRFLKITSISKTIFTECKLSSRSVNWAKCMAEHLMNYKLLIEYYVDLKLIYESNEYK